MRYFVFCFLVCTAKILSSTETNEILPLFCPPKQWQIIDARSLSPRVTVGFMKKVGSGFSPSINLATEKISCSETEYLKTVSSLYHADRETRWRDVGIIHTKAGDARLTEIDMKSKWGPVRMMQMLVIRDNTAYILTAAAPKKDFVKYSEDFYQCFTSFSLQHNILAMVHTEQEICLIKNKIDYLKDIKERISLEKDAKSFVWHKECIALEKFLSENFTYLGTYWQMLTMQYILEQASHTSSGKDA